MNILNLSKIEKNTDKVIKVELGEEFDYRGENENLVNREDLNRILYGRMYYPKNEQMFREYQFQIVKSALETNTLVCLPTGLGKTFIASTVIYNFHLWFSGKIFFLAPTKPLVNQQKNAFNNMFNLESIVAEVNGKVAKSRRESLYKNKKCFFMTPQTMEHDLKSNLIESKNISLIIFDEAHKAQGKYAYTNIVKRISEEAPSNFYRIVALTASPASNIDSIQSVIDNLKIKNVELRTENDAEIKPFIFNKEIKIMEVTPTNDIIHHTKLLHLLINERIEIFKKFKIIKTNLDGKFLFSRKLLEIQEDFKNRRAELENEIGPMMISETFKNFQLLFKLLFAKKLLENEGIESYKKYILDFEASQQKSPSIMSKEKKKSYSIPGKSSNQSSNSHKKLIESSIFQSIKMDLIRNSISGTQIYLDNNQNQKNSSYSFINGIKSIHPKLLKLSEIFNEKRIDIKNGSKVIIFTEYKESAKEILNYLQTCGEFCDISFSLFTGQDKNFKQRDQIETMKKFVKGEIKVLIATCVAEEGLDIGEVDLIICYDMTSTSPIKMIQRFGRTGRKRNGCVIVLALKGEEKSKYYKSLYRLKGINKELNGLKYNFTNKKIHFYLDNDNILSIHKEILENVEFIDLHSDIIEYASDMVSDSNESEEYSDLEDYDSKTVDTKSKFYFEDKNNTLTDTSFIAPKNKALGNIYTNNYKIKSDNSECLKNNLSLNDSKKLLHSDIKLKYNFNIKNNNIDPNHNKNIKIFNEKQVVNNSNNILPNKKPILNFSISNMKTPSGEKYITRNENEKEINIQRTNITIDDMIDLENFKTKNISDTPIDLNIEDVNSIFDSFYENKNLTKNNEYRGKPELIISDTVNQLTKFEEELKTSNDSLDNTLINNTKLCDEIYEIYMNDNEVKKNVENRGVNEKNQNITTAIRTLSPLNLSDRKCNFLVSKKEIKLENYDFSNEVSEENQNFDKKFTNRKRKNRNILTVTDGLISSATYVMNKKKDEGNDNFFSKGTFITK